MSERVGGVLSACEVKEWLDGSVAGSDIVSSSGRCAGPSSTPLDSAGFTSLLDAKGSDSPFKSPPGLARLALALCENELPAWVNCLVRDIPAVELAAAVLALCGPWLLLLFARFADTGTLAIRIAAAVRLTAISGCLMVLVRSGTATEACVALRVCMPWLTTAKIASRMMHESHAESLLMLAAREALRLNLCA